MKRISILYSIVISIALISSCINPKSIVRPAGSAEKLEVRKTHEGSDGFVYFVAFGKGANKKECLSNAKYLLLKEVIYKGIDQGTTMRPLVTSGEFANEFRENENRYLSRLLEDETLLKHDNTVLEKIATNEEKRKSLYQMSFQIGISPSQLKESLQRLK
ncbi:hypothetical protein GQF61_05135 [Sphingobacterium sp. DK4209]|uniref:Uncharacterized protein n=1 Tax=Sphingobacterium zhuxiongii TaxID=2662364 RepID=A0A5Q0Q9G1_9SPHI|nr:MULTISPECIES: hypothetical protein [unclassified Sphingobacterium]MVZ65228.1 hypothetical protein [Sphingobacterium sp. DK4209]QGA26173.1 hypothetical protein GFH32_07460 [Sphingobacterium sp. dk4302]